MPNQHYTSWLQNLMEVYFGVEDHFTTDPAMDVFVCGVNDSYVFSNAHTVVEDLGVNVVMTPTVLGNITLINGVFKCDVTEVDVDAEAGNQIFAMVIFVANADGSRLIAYIDEGQPTQLPLVLAKGKFFFRWNAAGVFRI